MKEKCINYNNDSIISLIKEVHEKNVTFIKFFRNLINLIRFFTNLILFIELKGLNCSKFSVYYCLSFKEKHNCVKRRIKSNESALLFFFVKI